MPVVGTSVIDFVVDLAHPADDYPAFHMGVCLAGKGRNIKCCYV